MTLGKGVLLQLRSACANLARRVSKGDLKVAGLSMRRIAFLKLLVVPLVIGGCAASPETAEPQVAPEGGYVVAYITSPDTRRTMEDQLVADLRARGMTAHVSYPDIPDIAKATGFKVLARAQAKHAASVLLINQVVPDERGLINNPVRSMPNYSDLSAFYEYAKDVEGDYVPGREVFAEVNLFVIDGDSAQLAWSEMTWSFAADGAGGAIRGISASVADQLEKIRNAYRAGRD
jgi:hypothetical protein